MKLFQLIMTAPKDINWQVTDRANDKVLKIVLIFFLVGSLTFLPNEHNFHVS